MHTERPDCTNTVLDTTALIAQGTTAADKRGHAAVKPTHSTLFVIKNDNYLEKGPCSKERKIHEIQSVKSDSNKGLSCSSLS